MTVEVQPWGMKPSLLVIIFCASVDVVGASRVLAYPTMKRCSSEVAQCSTSTKTKTGGGKTSSVVVGEKCYRNMKPVKLRPS